MLVKKIKFRFTGLCALVPAKEVGQANNEATILLVNSRQSHDPNHPHEPHHSVLLAQQKHFPNTADNRQHSFVLQPIVGPSLKVCPLGGEALTLIGLTDDGRLIPLPSDSLTFTTQPAVTPPCPTNDNVPNINWIAKNPGNLSSDLLTSMDVCDTVAVRMHLTVGTLSNGGFRYAQRGGVFGVVRWRFSEGASKALGEEVLYECRIPPMSQIAKVILQSTNFTNCPERRNIMLTPDDDEGLVEAFFANQPISSLLSIDPPRPFDPDYHFTEYYRLCRQPRPTIFPVPDLAELCPPFADPSNPKCPPTLFAPASALQEENVAAEPPTQHTGDHPPIAGKAAAAGEEAM
jgi:hypothetical protein